MRSSPSRRPALSGPRPRANASKGIKPGARPTYSSQSRSNRPRQRNVSSGARTNVSSTTSHHANTSRPQASALAPVDASPQKASLSGASATAASVTGADANQ